MTHVLHQLDPVSSEDLEKLIENTTNKYCQLVSWTRRRHGRWSNNIAIYLHHSSHCWSAHLWLRDVFLRSSNMPLSILSWGKVTHTVANWKAFGIYLTCINMF